MRWWRSEGVAVLLDRWKRLMSERTSPDGRKSWAGVRNKLNFHLEPLLNWYLTPVARTKKPPPHKTPQRSDGCCESDNLLCVVFFNSCFHSRHQSNGILVIVKEDISEGEKKRTSETPSASNIIWQWVTCEMHLPTFFNAVNRLLMLLSCEVSIIIITFFACVC